MRTIAPQLLFISQNLFALSAQSYTFSGVITNEKREMMDGVQVISSVEDLLSATALADEKGHFCIDGLKEGAYELRLLSLGYNVWEQILRVENRNVRKNFLLTPEKTAVLGEVMVAGNWNDQVNRVATEEIFYLSEKAKDMRNPFRALQKIPRLYSDVANRKMQSENGAQPLILINGNRYNSGITTLDPREIESVEIIDVVKARYLKGGCQKVPNIKLKKKIQSFIFLEGATRYDVPFRRGFGVGYFEVGNSQHALYGRASVDYLYDDRSEQEQRQLSMGYSKWTKGEECPDGTSYLGELQFRWMCTDKDYIVAHMYGSKKINKEKDWGDGLLTDGTPQEFDYSSFNKDQSYIFTASLFHKHTFAKGHILETTPTFNKNHNESDGNHPELYLDWSYLNTYLYKNDRNSDRSDVDYSVGFASGGSLDVGNQTRFTGDCIRQVSIGMSTFRHEKWEEYLYVDYSRSTERFSYMLSAGLEGIRLKTDEAPNHYFKSRIPSSGNYGFSGYLSTRLGYTLINTAPTKSELSPHSMPTDSLAKAQGDPYLLPGQNHKLNLSLTFNMKGFYLTPSVSYRISTDLVESCGFSEEGIYISNYGNSGKCKNLCIGGSLSYRIGNSGRIGVSAHHIVDYCENQDPRERSSCSLYFDANYKRWYLDADILYDNCTYTPIFRVKYHSPFFSIVRVSYNFTDYFYIPVAMENCLVTYRTSMELHSGSCGNYSD